MIIVFNQDSSKFCGVFPKSQHLSYNKYNKVFYVMSRKVMCDPPKKAILNTVVKLNNSCHNGQCSYFKSWKLWIQSLKTVYHHIKIYNTIQQQIS